MENHIFYENKEILGNVSKRENQFQIIQDFSESIYFQNTEVQVYAHMLETAELNQCQRRSCLLLNRMSFDQRLVTLCQGTVAASLCVYLPDVSVAEALRLGRPRMRAMIPPEQKECFELLFWPQVEGL